MSQTDTDLNNDLSSQLPWRKFASEFAGTGLLLLFGLSIVIPLFGAGSPIPALIPDPRLRTIIGGFLWGSVGGSIALSPVGKVSGAHINPVVTMGFWLMGKIETSVALGFILSQLLGGVVGCLPLLLWGPMGKSIEFGATFPSSGYTPVQALLGEAATTFGLVAALCVFIGYRPLRQFTPAMIPFLYAIMNPLEAHISGNSTNPARSFGPAVISGHWSGWWIYWVGPVIGMAVAIFLFSFLGMRVEQARLYHFESDERRVFRAHESGAKDLTTH